MTIERVTYPADLATWDPSTSPNSYYLEFFGETSPAVNTAYAEVLAAGGAVDGAPQTGAAAPVYEYWWTLGHSGGVPQDHPTLHERLGFGHRSTWDDLKDDAAHVVVAFPLGSGWRIKELTATLKYLSPTHDQKDLLHEAAEVWGALAPIMAAAGGIATGLPGAQLSAVVAADTVNTKPLNTAGDILDTLGKLSLNSVPAGNAFPWSVSKMTGKLDGEVTQAVLWQLPRKVFTDLGGRITGGISVSFIPDSVQRDGTVSTEMGPLRAANAGCSATMLTTDGPKPVPSASGMLKLTIAPTLPATKKPADQPRP